MTLWEKIVLCYSRVGGAGLCPAGPGTAGSAVAAIAAHWLFLPLPIPARLAVVIGIFLTGALAAGMAERLLGRSDPGEVVIDELLGVWLVLLPFQESDWRLLLAAFVFFRIFDIWKPGPIHASENWLPGGYGIMIDDVVAAVPALFCVAILRFLHIVYSRGNTVRNVFFGGRETSLPAREFFPPPFPCTCFPRNDRPVWSKTRSVSN